MSICQNCGEVVPDTAKFCRNCGSPIAAKPITPPQAAGTEESTVLLAEEPEPVNYAEPEPVRYAEPEPVRYTEPEPEPRQVRAQEPPKVSRPASPDAYDHTGEFDPKDISENKVVAMLIYLMGFSGIIIALLKCNTSPYAEFHVRQGLKFVALNCLIIIVELAITFILLLGGGVGSFGALSSYDSGMSFGSSFGGVGIFVGFMTLISIAVGIFGVILFIVKITCFFSICKGKAKEPAIVRSIPFLK